MLTAIFAFAYNILFFPVFFLLAHLAALFNVKIRKGILGRYHTQTLKQFSHHRVSSPLLLIHCASMGEFEHIKPFIRSFKHQFQQSQIVVMFFSPSGYENIKEFPNVDLIIYSPFDWWFPVLRTFRTLNPSVLVIAKHDVWPNQIWMANLLNIPCVLINASLYDKSRRLRPFFSIFHKSIYDRLERIITISEKDAQNYQKFVPAEKVVLAGDTKFEQALLRMEESKERKVLADQILENKRVFLAGSIWREDEEHLMPAIRGIAEKYSDLLLIACPHEPTESHIEELKEKISPLNYRLYSDIHHFQNEPVIIIDKVGLLANLYSVAHVAYVGGSFKQNVHNVLEPAVYGIPVIFGPINQNSHEAQLLKESGGGIEIHDSKDIEDALNGFFSDEFYRKKIGTFASKVVMDNTGATQRTIEAITPLLKRSK